MPVSSIVSLKIPKTRPPQKIWRPRDLPMCESWFESVASQPVDCVDDMHALSNACTHAYPHTSSKVRKHVLPSQAMWYLALAAD
eukprot:6410515-Karenia_brevis.AAC.1